MNKIFSKATFVQLSAIAFMLLSLVILKSSDLKAQIWPPEGLNLPGGWNNWVNPPSNNFALASSTQVPGGRVTKSATGTPRYQTIFSAAATGGDVVGGTYPWLFTSGPSGSPWNNKWADVVVIMNSLQTYSYNNGPDNLITVTNGKWYTMNWEDKGYMGTRAIFMETSTEPVNITSVSVPVAVTGNTPVTITAFLSQPPSPEEITYMRYSTDGWLTSTAITLDIDNASGSADIPGQPDGTVVYYYAFTSTVEAVVSDYDLYSIRINNNNGLNYGYAVNPPPPAIEWANLQSPPLGAVLTGQSFNVYGQAFIPFVTGQAIPVPGLQAWVGYNMDNTDPADWSNWIPATYNIQAGNNDEFVADLGAALTSEGSYFFATRFQLNSDPYVYGGYSTSNGGFWDGILNVSGQLIVTDPIINPDFDFVNLQGPGNGTIEPESTFNVYARAFIDGVTGETTPAPGVQVWIGYSTENTNPASWVNWAPAIFNGPVNGQDEYIANIGQNLADEGYYYYASRFQLNTGDYYFGGFSVSGGGTWDGLVNTSGILTVEIPPPPTIAWANLQWPGTGEIETGQDFIVYAQAYIAGITGQSTPAPGLEAWIGYSDTNTDPSGWTDWLTATYNTAVGNNDEFNANIGSQFNETGIRYYASRFRLNNGDYVYGGFSASGGGFWNGTNYLSGILTINAASSKTLNLTVLLEGIYDMDGQMKQANGESGPQFGAGIADLITVELHNENNYSTIEHEFPDIELGTDGTALISIPSSLNGTYYLTIKHRNSIETTSASPVSFADQSILFNFNQPATAFGNNLLETVDGWFVIYGGDVNQDGVVDTGDVTPLDNDQFNYLTGYVPTDANGDGSVDTGDITIVDNNQFNYVGAILP